MAQNTIKYASGTISVGGGNAFAFFIIEYLDKVKNFQFDDPVVAVAFGGAALGIFFLELKKIGRGIKYVFDRAFPEKTEDNK